MKPARPMEFGIGIYPYDRLTDIREMVRVVRRADELGFDVLGLPEHLLPPPESHDMLANRTWWDLPTLFAYLAAHTTRIRFLASVFVLPYHDPINLAKQLVTLDHVSNGRLICGIGAGWFEEEFRRLGLSYEERGDITDEYIRAMKELWTSENPTFQGNYVSFHDVSFYPKPLQRPSIPIVVGGTGSRPFRRAVEVGDGWYPMTGTRDEVAAHVAEIRARAKEAGRDPDAMWFGYTGLGMGDDPETRRARQHAGDAIAESRQRTSDEAIEEIRRFRDIGINFLSIGFQWRTAEEFIAQMERFAGEVMPAFR